MNINQSDYNKVIEYIDYVINDELSNMEFEALFKLTLDSDKFKRVFNYFKKFDNEYVNISEAEEYMLDIFSCNNELRQHRLTIKDKNTIINYCKDNITTGKVDTLIIKKKVEKFDPIDIPNYKIRFNLKNEISINDNDNISRISKIYDQNTKKFRYKQRYSFLSKNGLFRIDLTIVKSQLKFSKNFVECDIINSANQYEIEIEFQKENLKEQITTKQIALQLLDICACVLSVIHKSRFLMTPEENKNVLANYMSLIKDIVPKNQKKNNQPVYIGPQPVTLEQQNIITKLPDEALGIISIADINNSYTVTDKADGERMLLFVNNNNNIYLINNRFTIVDTGLKHEAKNTIIDGELVTKDLQGNNIKLYMCFDVYYYNGKFVYGHDLITESAECRIKFVTERFLKDSTLIKSQKNSEIKIKPKIFYKISTAQSIFTLSKKILDKEAQLPYRIDGLIYTPANLPVGGTSTDKSKFSLFGTWSRVFKWKPPEENTIDFLVRYDKNLDNSVENRRMCQLFSAGNVQNDNIDPLRILTTTKPNVPDYQEQIYQAIWFADCLLEIDQNSNNIFTVKPREIINNDIIVEFAYDATINSKDEARRWIPNRIRHDKTELYKQTSSMARTANNINTAKKIFATIVESPISKNMITGLEQLPADILDKIKNSEVYYNREVNRYNSLLYNMLNFHNSWIKDKYLYSLFKKESIDLFEIACGKGGDLSKWINYDYKSVVGIDISPDNIMNTNDGIYARYSSLSNNNKKKINPMMFLIMDASVKWNKTYIKSIDDNESLSKQFAEILWGIKNAVIKKNSYFDAFYEAIDKKKFNLVSCQFAIHYFFENQAILDNFIDNLDLILRPGGYFIGTSLDGNLVDREFNKNETTKIEGVESNKILWRIRKDENYGIFDKENPHKNYGKKIYVYVETINKETPEYLVDFELLKSKLEDKKIRMLNQDEMQRLQKQTNNMFKSQTSSDLFGTVYQDNIDAIENENNKYCSITSENIKKYSFLNRFWIFKKDI